MSGAGRFPGGVTLPAGKERSRDVPIRTPALPPELILPLGDAALLVPVGELVLKGQVLAAQGRDGLPLHAPTSGCLAAVAVRPLHEAADGAGRCAVLVPDGREHWIARTPLAGADTRSTAELLAAVRDAGLVGLGGGGFPTAVKLAPSRPIDTLVVNGMECESGITADDRLMREEAPAIVAGIRLAARILGHPARIPIGIEDDKPEAAAAMQAALTAADLAAGMAVVVLPTRYPAGGERQLIQSLTGRQVPSDGLPADIGAVCFNVGTLHALHRALAGTEPLLSRVVTVTGGACREPANYRALLGTPIAHLLAASGHEPARSARLLVGGPMMGTPLTDIQAPVTKTTLCILAASAAELAPARDPQPCIRCGLCAEVCPASLLPQQLLRHAVTGNLAQLERHHLFDCIECGACAYVCPSAIPLVDHYRAAKAAIRARREDRARADRARRRFAEHQARALRRGEERARRHGLPVGDVVEQPSAAPAAASVAADLVRDAQARAQAATPRRAQLERALRAAESRIAQLDSQLAALDTQTSDAQRKALHARVQQAHLDADLARRRLAALPAESAAAADRAPR